MKVRDLIKHLERVEETVGNMLVLVDGYESGMDELNRIHLVRVLLGLEDSLFGDYFQTWDDDDEQAEQAILLCHRVLRQKGDQ